jgi:diphosphomevalonate decarboxylase
LIKSAATAIAHPNIAFIKYWGNQDDKLRIPANGSISMNLMELETRTTVTFDENLKSDILLINGKTADNTQSKRVSSFLDVIREKSGTHTYASLYSTNNFPIGSGIASSASAFAALALAGSAALGLNLSESELSRLARLGSGSASRSIPAGYVEWHPGEDDQTSYAFSILPPGGWDLVDIVLVLDQAHKKTGSSEGHHIASTSPLQQARVSDAPRRLDICRSSILEKDFSTFAEIIELDCLMMHSVMMTSTPPLFYWTASTYQIIEKVREWRKGGLPVAFTIDAGPNVHLITIADNTSDLVSQINRLSIIQSHYITHPGGSARLLTA